MRLLRVMSIVSITLGSAVDSGALRSSFDAAGLHVCLLRVISIVSTSLDLVVYSGAVAIYSTFNAIVSGFSVL
ncbi:hypothetical protein BDZ94DRAFT_1268997 [Collybia nuda]|uniref:Uncharacterized protein n=1 Tax=Collybia nuda TaxID=64659 RepID=A0A9P5Y0P8_9AGAR|nr:hypothetical protein BDZ94DRAFT_1268997 [Collybia nuda]